VICYTEYSSCRCSCWPRRITWADAAGAAGMARISPALRRTDSLPAKKPACAGSGFRRWRWARCSRTHRCSSVPARGERGGLSDHDHEHRLQAREGKYSADDWHRLLYAGFLGFSARAWPRVRRISAFSWEGERLARARAAGAGARRAVISVKRRMSDRSFKRLDALSALLCPLRRG